MCDNDAKFFSNESIASITAISVWLSSELVASSKTMDDFIGPHTDSLTLTS